MAEVTIYTQPRSLHCYRANLSLRQRGASIREIKTSRDLDRTRSELRDRFGADTFPQIIIGERPWQASDDVGASVVQRSSTDSTRQSGDLSLCVLDQAQGLRVGSL